MKTENLKILWIVSPCFNDADTIRSSVPVISETLNQLVANRKVSDESKLFLIDDGSSDDTWNEILRLREAFGHIEGMKLSSNQGEEKAYLAGIGIASEKADIIITLDCDLQDDIEKIDEMLAQYEDGAEIVHGCRIERSKDSRIYRFCADSFYFLMNCFGSKIIPHSSTFKLMTKNACQQLTSTNKKNVFLPAEIPLINVKPGFVYYPRKDRIAGKSGYNYLSLFKMALHALFDYTSIFESALIGFSVTVVVSLILLNKESGETE